ncbi:MAG: hypothetical protein M0026_05865 [Nocardiopsaceae bacterium]|nr:hypothetical protein [Nocardiopsaceae bacterium]
MRTTASPPDSRTGGTGGAESAYLSLRFVLTDSLIVRSGYDPLRITTDPVINGRAQRGMLAAALRHAGRSDLIEEWIARGETVRFAPAFPRLEDGTRAMMTVPTPRAWHIATTDGVPGGLVDLVAEAGAPGATYRSLGGLVTPDLTERAMPVTRTEQYLGTARTGNGSTGVPFFTTSLDPGQVFEARWQLRAATRTELRSLAARILDVLTAADGLLSLGSGSGRAHGGGIRITPAHSRTDLLTADRVDAGRCAWERGHERDLLLLAPALIDDDQGRPCPAALPDTAARVLADLLGPDAAEVTGAHVGQQPVGAYHRMYQGPMAERWTAAPGSVVRLRARRDITLHEIRAVEARALGRRAADGYGAAALLPIPVPVGAPIDRPPLASSSGAPPEPGRRFAAPAGRPGPERTELRTRPVPLADGSPAWVDPTWVAAQAGADPSTSPVARLQDALLGRAAAEPVRARARDLAHRSARLPPLSLLARLREVAAAPASGPAAVLARIAGVAAGDPDRSAPHTPFTEAARQAAAETSIPHGSGESTLIQWLEESARTPAAWWEQAGPDTAVLEAALLPVDLAWERGGGLSDAARAWQARPDVVARFVLLLIGTWFSTAAWIGRDAGRREEVR